MDFLHILKPVPMSSTDPVSFNLSAERLNEAVLVIIGHGGKRLKGFKAISYCALTSPPLFPLFLLMLILRLSGNGDRVYNKIASNRYLISGIIRKRIDL